MIRARVLLLSFAWGGVVAAQTGAAAPAQQHSEAASTEHQCPWLTAGSAARILGGDVSFTVSGTTAEDSCRFSRNGDAVETLEIVVGPGGVMACPANSTKLVGIGNEAAKCRISGARGEMAEMISGRVRDDVFSVTLRTRRQSRSSADEAADELDRIAEQVAGNLF